MASEISVPTVIHSVPMCQVKLMNNDYKAYRGYIAGGLGAFFDWLILDWIVRCT